jgi:Carboxymuconolactone decarboxylase family
VVVSVLAALGQLDEIKPHIRGALNLGWTVDELREALLRVLSEIATHRWDRGLGPGPDSPSTSGWAAGAQ